MAFASLQPLLTGAQAAFKNYHDTKGTKDAINEYLTWCKKNGKDPEKPSLLI
jgi:predicted HicB family RNase H-like nuclease